MEWGIYLKRRYLNTIRKKMIFMQVALLVVIMGIICGLFLMFADNYYYSSKLEAMENAFEELKTKDISALTETDTLIMKLEEQRFRVVISDENFGCVYVSGPKPDSAKQQAKINTKIIKRAQKFKAELTKKNKGNKILSYGYIEQNGHKYYIYIYERKLNTKIHFSYYKLFFVMISIAALIVGTLVSWMISNKISKPIRKIERATGNAVENNFEGNIDEVQEFAELEGLAKSVNIMLVRIRKQIKELEEELAHKSMVEERRRAFVNNVSHELKTPLAIISSQVEMLQLIDDDNKRREYCDYIIDETKNMAELINDMITVYSTQNDEQAVEMKEFDIGVLMEKICLKYKDLFENETIKLHQSYEENCNAIVDVKHIEQAIGNYITNSIKHSEENGNVYVRVMHKDSYVRIEVENEGENIPEQLSDKIWDMFYSGDTTENLQGQKGSGLGLYIVKSITILHNGKYGFDNLENGVVFWIEIPKKH